MSLALAKEDFKQPGLGDRAGTLPGTYGAPPGAERIRFSLSAPSGPTPIVGGWLKKQFASAVFSLSMSRGALLVLC